MATEEQELNDDRRYSSLSESATIRPSKMKRVTIVNIPTAQLACEESVHYPVFNPSDPRHNPSARCAPWANDDYYQPQQPAPDSTASWRKSLPMRSLRKARSSFLALKSGIKRRPSIFGSNHARDSPRFLADRETYEKGPPFSLALSEASTAEDGDFGTHLHRTRWMPRGDLASFMGYRGVARTSCRPCFPVPVPGQRQPWSATDENLSITQVGCRPSNGTLQRNSMPVVRPTVPPTPQNSRSSNLSNLSRRTADSPYTRGAYIQNGAEFSPETTLVNPRSPTCNSPCSMSLKSASSQYSNALPSRPGPRRFYRSIDPDLISKGPSDDYALPDVPDTPRSLYDTSQDIQDEVESHVSSGARTIPRVVGSLRQLVGRETVSDRVDLMAHRNHVGDQTILSSHLSDRSSVAADHAISGNNHRVSTGADLMRLSLRLPSLILRIDFPALVSWGRAECTKGS